MWLMKSFLTLALPPDHMDAELEITNLALD